MKRKIIQITGILLTLFFLQACKAKKGGCGLTSDAVKIEQINQQNTIASTVK